MRILSLCLAAAAALFADGAAGVHWTAPADWKAEAQRPMRAATYTIGAAAGDTEGAECVAYYFGQGQGGTVEANVERWKGQFLGSDGKAAPAKIAESTIHGLKVTTIESSGVYTGMGGPMAKEHPRKSGYRLLGAIIDAPGGLIFFKFTGPAKTIEANRAAFRKMLDSVQKGA